MTSIRLRILVLLVSMVSLLCEAQNCGWSRVDHRVSYDASGMWNPSVYRGLVGGLTIAQVGGAFWEGSETRFGKTMWQGIDAQLVASVSAQAGKYIFTRARPDQANNPCLWFQGGSHDSFPSFEASVAAALVTPYVLEYGSDSAATYALLLLPLYVGVGRVKNQAHWQTDVIAGWTVGGLSGWAAHSLKTPFMIQLLPHGVALGFKRRF